MLLFETPVRGGESPAQRIITERCFLVPRHGSVPPNCGTVALILQLLLPTQSFDTMDVTFAAAQAGFAVKPVAQLPPGNP